MSAPTANGIDYELWVRLQQTAYLVKRLSNKNSGQDGSYAALSKSEKEEMSASLQKLCQASVAQLDI
ncbi:MAG: hypothetical protein V3S51_07540 [Dehalococcoidia bacterium]